MTINFKSESYKNLCTEYYDIDKPFPPQEALNYYLTTAKKAKGPILEPMCGTGRFLIPLSEAGYPVSGFDNSEQMLNVCRSKCRDKNLKVALKRSGFNDFNPSEKFNLIFIPSGSFCLLTDPNDAANGLRLIHEWLSIGGKFIFEVDTLNAAGTTPGIWRANWVRKSDGSLIVLNHASLFDEKTHIETTLCRYEHWKNNEIIQTEVEEFCVKLYSIQEIEALLNQHGFKIHHSFIPYTFQKANENAASVLFECVTQIQRSHSV